MTRAYRKDGPGKKFFQEAIKSLDKKELKVGWFKTAVYENGEQVANVAAIQEYGFPAMRIPPRPMFGPTIRKDENKWKAIIKTQYQQAFNGKKTVIDAMQELGIAVQNGIKRTIADTFTPPLKESTKKARLRKLADGKKIGSLTKPLIETSLMFNSVFSIVEEGK